MNPNNTPHNKHRTNRKRKKKKAYLPWSGWVDGLLFFGCEVVYDAF